MINSKLIELVRIIFIFLLQNTISVDSQANTCDLGPSDVIFLVKASHLLQNEEFLNIKEFMKRFSSTLDLGRDTQNTQVGVVFFDNIKDPITKIELFAYGRQSDLALAIENLKKMPCGSSWCKEVESGTQKAVEYSLKQFSIKSNRMKKIVIIQSGSGLSEDYYFYRSLTERDANLKIVEILFGTGVITYDNPYYNYYMSYNDPYKRYMSRYQQLYPNVTLQQPTMPSPPTFGPQVQDGRITVSDSLDMLKMREAICSQTFACPICESDVNDDKEIVIVDNDRQHPMLPVLPSNFGENTDSKNILLQSSKFNRKPATSTEDYEYEIVADPPGLKINPNPAKDDVDMMRTTVSTPEYEYEDDDKMTSENTDVSENSSDLMKRSKRQVRYPAQRQSECTCSKPVIEANSNSFLQQRRFDYSNPYYSGYEEYNTYTSGCPYYPCYQPQQQQRRYPYGCSSNGYASPGCPYRSYSYGPVAPVFPQAPVYPSLPVFQQQQPFEIPAAQVVVDGSQNAGILKSESNDDTEDLKVNDGSSTGISEKLKEIPYFSRAARDTVFETSNIRRIDSISHVLPDLLKPRPVSLNHLLSPFSSASTASVTERIELNPQANLNESQASTTSSLISNLKSKVKKPDSGSILSDLDGMRHRHKRSFPFYPVQWIQHVAPTYPTQYNMNWPTSATPIRIHGTSTYQATSNSINCTFRGTDVVIYIDDINIMDQYTFENIKIIIRQLYNMFEDNTNTCNQVSRLSLLKTVPAEFVKTLLNFQSSTTKYENDYMISNLQYGGCNIQNSQCEMTLANAVVMGTNTLTMDMSDREKLLILISSRDSEQIKKISRSMMQGQEYARKNNIRIMHVSAHNGSKGVFSPTIRLSSLLSTTCSLSPTLDVLRNKKQYCPWSSI